MEPDKKTNGAFIGLIIIIVILIVGAIYIWITNKNSTDKIQNTEARSEVGNNQAAAALDALDNDIGTTDTNVSSDVNSAN